MPERDSYIAGVPCWVDTWRPDPDAAAGFYGGLFGWEFEESMPAGSPGRYLIARLRYGVWAAVSSQPEGAPPEAVWNTYIWVDDADESAAKAREAGGSVLSEPFDVMDAGRFGDARRSGGSRILRLLGGRKEHKGAGIVNEPGSLNFNVLDTRDPEAAKRFYSVVFGWTTLDLGSGEFWTLGALRRLPRGAHTRDSRTSRAVWRSRVRGCAGGDHSDRER